MFLRFDLTKDFYFSYTYDLTNSLQYNMSRRRDQQEVAGVTAPPYNDMFVWNHHLLGPLKDVSTSAVNYWLTPIIHGSFVQNSTQNASATSKSLALPHASPLSQKLMHSVAICNSRLLHVDLGYLPEHAF
jgi:hypothetical protein